MGKSHATLVPIERIENKIFLIRGQKVMLDMDLALLYDTPTSQLKRAVRRNIQRFPEEFMFILNKKELTDLICQIGIARWGGTRHLPFAFTEHGVAMLSSILKSERAIQVNIAIIKAFVRMRQLLASHNEIRQKLMEHDRKITLLIDAVDQLMAPPPASKKPRIGFQP